MATDHPNPLAKKMASSEGNCQFQSDWMLYTIHLQYHDWGAHEQGTEPLTAPRASQHKWLPTAPCVCSLLCVCVHFGWVKCRAQIPSMCHHTWPYVTSLSLYCLWNACMDVLTNVLTSIYGKLKYTLMSFLLKLESHHVFIYMCNYTFKMKLQFCWLKYINFKCNIA